MSSSPRAWALITQRAEQRGASRGCNSAHAAFTVAAGDEVFLLEVIHADTVDKVLETLMIDGIKVAGGDRWPHR